MKVFIFIHILCAIYSAKSYSLLSDCSQYQPFKVVRDDGSVSVPYDYIPANISSSSDYNVNFYLYTSGYPDAIDLQSQGAKNFIYAQYNNKLPLIVIVHGWLGNASIGSAKAIKNSIHRQEYGIPSNIITVDWSGPANDESYTFAPAKVPFVGQKIGKLLLWFTKATETDLSIVHLVGYDLGAHVVGIAGRTIGGNVGRITGLDPIAPCFKGTDSSLSKSDGMYVEVIHTDCAFNRSLGIIMPMGHADFYPNNCNLQPGCEDYVCSHTRSYELFAASIVHNELVGYKCNNIWEVLEANCQNNESLNMGNIDLNKRGEGLYTLSTAGGWPFNLFKVERTVLEDDGRVLDKAIDSKLFQRNLGTNCEYEDDYESEEEPSPSHICSFIVNIKCKGLK